VKRFRSDGGGEDNSKKLAEYQKSEGILKETTTPYTLQFNGVVERVNRTIMERVRCMLDDAELSKKYWAFAVSVAVYLKNRTPTRSVVGMTPYEAWHGSRKKQSMKNLRVFRCLAFVNVPEEKLKKLDYRATPGIFVGYSIWTKQYFVYDPLGKTLHCSRDVVIREGKRYKAPNTADEAILTKHFYRDVIEEHKPNSTEKQPSKRQTEDSVDDESPPKPKKQSRELAGLESSLGDAWKPPAEGHHGNRGGKLAESAQLALEDEEFDDMIPISAAAAISDDHEDGINNPKSYKAATESPLSEKWDTVMKQELDAIGQYRVFGEFVELPEGRKALPSHRVYKIKRDGAGDVQRFKARLVCGGHHQIEGIDDQATYAPTARLGHVRLALAISAKYNFEIHQMDVCTAFLGVDLQKEIHMHPPQGYYRLVQTARLTKSSRKMVLHLRKSFYGLKQPLRVWYGTFKDFVISNGFEALRVDGGLFVLHNKDQDIVVAVVVLYVDDLLIIANEGLIGQIKDQMKKRFRIHDLGSVSFYLGMNIECNREHHTIDIHEHIYIRTIFVKFRMDESRPVTTPIEMKLHKRKPDEEACDPPIYQSMIGCLMYAMTATLPDMAYAIAVLSRYNHDPSNEHTVALKRVFRYLNGTKDWRLPFGGALEGESVLRCYVDSHYAGCPDDYNSTSTLVITFTGAVNWRSRKQKSTAQSTTDAE